MKIQRERWTLWEGSGVLRSAVSTVCFLIRVCKISFFKEGKAYKYLKQSKYINKTETETRGMDQVW